jgi:hypothetical protein
MITREEVCKIIEDHGLLDYFESGDAVTQKNDEDKLYEFATAIEDAVTEAKRGLPCPKCNGG